MPAFPANLLGDLPPAALVVGFAAFLAYKAACRIIDKPLILATIVGVFGNEQRRKDAIKIVGKLCGDEQEPEKEDTPSIAQTPATVDNGRGKRDPTCPTTDN
ncbi:hypothetical protein O7605_31740 [Verrucosispora sp. WMMA2121]|uniref:hypothetical protein n=1 Tax=Verrucosispora sp. WMMA2121 TaxID=3015164 RepID=UPI0022B66C70|nr:hypothetical protein [Verrucosispora sp. WMMA2121]MCZ7423786.1 hypothetical protein [Verrucosispora sp. WMMA2121]MCZ7424072.1 hypothetical protein [Verrucosispora sp. WMMA2121]MCZ7424087.1 hypothetical protein [Verrucosispora sp. WMMA2121]